VVHPEARVEPGQAGIIFDKSGLFAPNGLGSWYLAVFTWGPWIVFISIAQACILAREKATAPYTPRRTVDSLNQPDPSVTGPTEGRSREAS
jgi:hypothetical protein